GLFDMLLERENTLRLHQLEQTELQPQQLHIRRLVVARAAYQRPEHVGRLPEHRARVADHESTCRRAEDDERLEWLEQDFEMPAHGDIAAQYAGKNDDGADKKAHT